MIAIGHWVSKPNREMEWTQLAKIFFIICKFLPISLEGFQSSKEKSSKMAKSWQKMKKNLLFFYLYSTHYSTKWILPENPKPQTRVFGLFPNWKLPRGSTSIHARLFASWDIFTRSHFRIFIAISSICSTTLSLEMVRTSLLLLHYCFCKTLSSTKICKFLWNKPFFPLEEL